MKPRMNPTEMSDRNDAKVNGVANLDGTRTAIKRFIKAMKKRRAEAPRQRRHAANRWKRPRPQNSSIPQHVFGCDGLLDRLDGT